MRPGKVLFCVLEKAMKNSITDSNWYQNSKPGLKKLEILIFGCGFSFLTSITSKCFSFALSLIEYAPNLSAFKYFETFFTQRNISYATSSTLSHCRQDAHETNQTTNIQLCILGGFYIAFCCASLTLHCSFAVCLTAP